MNKKQRDRLSTLWGLGLKSQAGFSLVETIIASGLLILLGLGLSKLTNNFLTAGQAKSSKMESEKLAQTLSRTIKREWDFRAQDKPATAVSVSGCKAGTADCQTLQILRVKTDATGDMPVSFISSCTSTLEDPKAQSMVKDLDFAPLMAKTKCMRHLACKKGSIPWVELQAGTGAGAPLFPKQLSPPAKAKPQGAIGLALCSTYQDGTLKVVIESFYIKSRGKDQTAQRYELGMSRKEMSLTSERDSDGLQLYSTEVEIK